MIEKFFLKKKQTKSYDKIPPEFFGNPKRIWQAQIAGEKKFESCNFMGALNDLQGISNWQEAFQGIEECTGMPAFLERLQKHFDLCEPHNTPDETSFLYQHPSRALNNLKINKDCIIAITQRHIKTLAAAYKLSGQLESSNILNEIPIVWHDSTKSDNEVDLFEEGNGQGAAGLYINEAWDFSHRNDMYKEGIPSIIHDIEESVYSLANDFSLQRYLMQSFMTHGLDVDAEYELRWINNCTYYFDETTCYVTKAPN